MISNTDRTFYMSGFLLCSNKHFCSHPCLSKVSFYTRIVRVFGNLLYDVLSSGRG